MKMMSLVKSKTIGMIFGQTICKGEIMKTVKYIVYPKLGNKTTKFEFDNAMDAVKWAKDNIYAFDYVKEKKDEWEDLFYELLVGIDKGGSNMSNFVACDSIDVNGTSYQGIVTTTYDEL